MRRRQPSRRGQAARLADVARLAGVSTASVSRAINGSAGISPEIARKVREAAAELGYAPHAAARALAAARSHTIGIVVPTIAFSIFAPGIEAIERELEPQGYCVLIAMSGYDVGKEFVQTRRLLARGVDGIILVGLTHDPRLKTLLQGAGVPYVCQGAFDGGRSHPCCGFENFKAILPVVDHLTGLGHERIAILAGIARDNDRVKDRIRGIKQRLRRFGLAPVAIAQSRYDIAEGRKRTAELLAARPTAIICINDVLATAAIFELQSRGLDVPGDVSVTGFDDRELAENMYPSLTTVRVPVDLMGSGAARMLLARLRREDAPEAMEIETTLIVRGSTGPCRR